MRYFYVSQCFVKNGVRNYLDRKQLSVARFSEQTGLPEALVVALYNDVRLMPPVEAQLRVFFR